jgi:hypothetical protein
MNINHARTIMKTGNFLWTFLAACVVLGMIVSSATADKGAAVTIKESSAMQAVSPKAATYDIPWHVISGGGGHGTSVNYSLNGTAGQTAVGYGTSASYALSSGYWQVFGGGGATCCVVAGDSDNNGAFNISDAVHDINHVFKGGPPAVCCDAADADNNGTFNISDAVYKINRVFKGGPPPVCGSAGNGPCP